MLADLFWAAAISFFHFYRQANNTMEDGDFSRLGLVGRRLRARLTGDRNLVGAGLVACRLTTNKAQ